MCAPKPGGLDILVNNAGIAGQTGAAEDIDPNQWERTISTNLNRVAIDNTPGRSAVVGQL